MAITSKKLPVDKMNNPYTGKKFDKENANVPEAKTAWDVYNEQLNTLNNDTTKQKANLYNIQEKSKLYADSILKNQGLNNTGYANNVKTSNSNAYLNAIQQADANYNVGKTNLYRNALDNINAIQNNYQEKAREYDDNVYSIALDRMNNAETLEDLNKIYSENRDNLSDEFGNKNLYSQAYSDIYDNLFNNKAQNYLETYGVDIKNNFGQSPQILGLPQSYYDAFENNKVVNGDTIYVDDNTSYMYIDGLLYPVSVKKRKASYK